MALDLRGFIVPETPFRESDAANQYYDRQLQQKRYDYLLQKEKEADDWKKLGLIQDLTDLSKHQTGSDVANAIGNQKATDIFQKYVGAAGTMSPNQLAAGIQKDMSGLVTSMDGIKTELSNADQQMSALKKIYPNLDYASMTRDLRADVLNRHMKTSNEFYNPVEIQPSNVDLSNPQLLSHYLPNTNNLDDAIINPKGLDEQQVLSGGEMSHIQYKGKVPFWRQPNYTPEMIQKGGGFLPKGFVPQMNIKSEDMPTDVLPALKGNQRKMVTSDVYQQLYNQHPLEVEKGTRDMFGGIYDKMNNHEKELAQRDFLYSKIAALDKNNFYQGTATHTPISLIKLNMGTQGKSGGDSNADFINLYKSLKGKTELNKTTGFTALSGDEQNMVRGFLSPEQKKEEDSLELTRDVNDNILVLKKDKDMATGKEQRTLVTTLNPEGINIKGSTPLGIKAKKAAHEDAKHIQPTQTHKKGDLDDL